MTNEEPTDDELRELEGMIESLEDHYAAAVEDTPVYIRAAIDTLAVLYGSFQKETFARERGDSMRSENYECSRSTRVRPLRRAEETLRDACCAAIAQYLTREISEG